jgi:hypothetical protein
MTGLPVINRERMERLRPHPVTSIPFNMNTVSIVIVILCMFGLYRRYVIVNKSREQRHI